MVCVATILTNQELNLSHTSPKHLESSLVFVTEQYLLSSFLYLSLGF